MQQRMWLVTALVGVSVAFQPNCGRAGGHFTEIRLSKYATSVYGINDSGTITGAYDGGNLGAQGFLRTSDGTVTTFNVVDAYDTVGVSINNDGVIAGMFAGSSSWQPFVRNTDGSITTYYISSYNGTVPTGINDSGTIVGRYDDNHFNDHGFIITSDGTVSTFDVPGATSTTPLGINSSGYVVGYYWTNPHTHGFIMAPDGPFTTFDVPNAQQTYATSINDSGVVVGYYYGIGVGFVRAADGTFTTINCPDSGGQCELSSINNSGQIAGNSNLGNGVEVGFSQSPDGTTQIFQPRKYPANFLDPVKINSSGWIVGSYGIQPRKREKYLGFLGLREAGFCSRITFAPT